MTGREPPRSEGGARAPSIALVAPRNMRFSPRAATSIDLHIHETARWSAYRAHITVFAEEVDEPFADVATRFWPQGRQKGNLERLLAAERPDVIVAHQHLPTAARLARRFPGVPVALVRHNFQAPPRNFFSALHKRRCFNRLAAIAFVSEGCRADFLSNWSGLAPPVHVMPNGVDIRLWCAGRDKAAQILFCGRLTPAKGVLEAALGVERALAGRDGWRAVFILADGGDHGAYAAEVHAVLARLGPRVRVIENADHTAVRAAMAESAILVAPTQGEESFGRVVLEGMASGATVVASRASGFVEVLGEAGVLLERPDAGHVAEALERLIASPEDRRRLAAAGRERAEEHHHMAAAVRHFDQLAARLLARRGTVMDDRARLG